MIEDFAKTIPSDLQHKSGIVFYSGRIAFSGCRELYILGLNPGGNPTEQANETVAWHTSNVLNNKPDKWSEYSNECWEGKPPGKHGIQPKILHLLKKIDLEPGEVPSSNIVFERSRTKKDIEKNWLQLAEACWSFHRAVIKQLRPRSILCFGRKAGNFVRKKVCAVDQIDCFVENNNRRWKSTCFANREGLKVISVAHPSRANWVNPKADPSELVLRALRS
ncbi:MAG: hypothetical protein J4G06_02345 [Caldilineaceae bacterium]|nr:hypothetical protein [Caldilineaceae bacterium]